jgi:hypothetical protein
MLNTCLTVRAHEANSHAGKGWEKFTQKVIDLVCQKRTNGVVFLAWGSPAQKRCAGINGSKHYVLKSVHPSPLSAHKGFVSPVPSGRSERQGANQPLSSIVVTLQRRMNGSRRDMAKRVSLTGTSMSLLKTLAFEGMLDDCRWFCSV